MKFRNKTDAQVHVPALDLYVDPGETTPDFDKKTAASFLEQVKHGSDTWAAVGEEAKAAVHKAAAANETQE